jgi:TPR repeat protein
MKIVLILILSSTLASASSLPPNIAWLPYYTQKVLRNLSKSSYQEGQNFKLLTDSETEAKNKLLVEFTKESLLEPVARALCYRFSLTPEQLSALPADGSPPFDPSRMSDVASVNATSKLLAAININHGIANNEIQVKNDDERKTLIVGAMRGMFDNCIQSLSKHSAIKVLKDGKLPTLLEVLEEKVVNPALKIVSDWKTADPKNAEATFNKVMSSEYTKQLNLMRTPAGRSTIGRGDPPTAASRIDAIREAAAKGDAKAQYDIGYAYASGQGVPQDHKQAVAWYRRAAEQGLFYAQYMLGMSYFQGLGVEQDDAQGVAWIRKAAEQGFSTAQYLLAAAYAQGKGIRQDDTQATAWFRQAADQGRSDAQFDLGLRYYEGRGVPQDLSQSMVWFQKSADQGFVRAQVVVARGYAEGRGVAKDNIEAYRWYTVAASLASGEERALLVVLCEASAKLMTPAEILEARRRAMEWQEAFARRRPE